MRYAASSELNTAVGINSLAFMCLGCQNVGIGANALLGSRDGTYNTAIGASAGRQMRDGYRNVYAGYTAGYENCSGYSNVAIGAGALVDNVHGIRNTAVGDTALLNATANYNVAVGYLAGECVTTAIETTNIGYRANRTGDCQTCIAGEEVFLELATASDERAKCCITSSALGLDFINQLRPVSYKWKQKQDRPKTDGDGNPVLDNDGEQIIERGFKQSAKRTHYGLIAQDVKQVLDDLNIDTLDFSGYIDQTSTRPDWKPAYHEEDITLALRYEQFIAPMIKAIQELKNRVEVLESE